MRFFLCKNLCELLSVNQLQLTYVKILKFPNIDFYFYQLAKKGFIFQATIFTTACANTFHFWQKYIKNGTFVLITGEILVKNGVATTRKQNTMNFVFPS